MTEEFLSERGVPFEIRDIINDKSAMDELVRLGVLTTPVTLIDGEVVVGFNRNKLELLLAN